MKKVIGLILLCVILTTVPVFAEGKVVKDSFKLNSGYIYLDNNLIDGESLTYKGVTYLPVRKISETVGLSVVYDKSNNKINLVDGGTKLNNANTVNKYTKSKTDDLSINNVTVYVNGVQIDSDNIMYNGTTYLPLRKIAEAIGLNVNYHTTTSYINLNSNTNSKEVKTTNNLKPTLTKSDIDYPNEPKTVEDMKKVLLYMANNNLSELDIRYKGDYFDLFVRNTEIENNMYSAFQSVYVEYVDLFSSVENIKKTYRNEDNGEYFILTIKLNGMTLDNKNFTETQSNFETEAYKLNEELIKNGTIKSDMRLQ